MINLKLLALIGIVSWFLPVFRFTKNKFFFFFYANAVADPIYIIFRHIVHYNIPFYIPLMLFIESITLPVNDYKSKIISTVILLLVVIKIGNDPFLEFIGCEIVNSIIIMNLLYDMYMTLKYESSIPIFEVFLVMYILQSVSLVYFFYDALDLLIQNTVYLQIVGILISISITYFGPDKKIRVNWLTNRNKNKSSTTYDLNRLDYVLAGTEIKLKELTWTELRVLYYLADGKDYNEICKEMSIGKRTVYFHIQNIKSKMNIHSTSRLKKIALESHERLQKVHEVSNEYGNEENKK